MNGAAAVWVFLSCTCPVLSLVGQASTRKTHGAQNMGPEYILGQLTAIVMMTTVIPAILLFFGLKKVVEALDWKKATAFLIPLGILVTSCICGGIFFYVGIIVAVNRRLAHLGAPNWSSINTKKLTDYANSLG